MVHHVSLVISISWEWVVGLVVSHVQFCLTGTVEMLCISVKRHVMSGYPFFLMLLVIGDVD